MAKYLWDQFHFYTKLSERIKNLATDFLSLLLSYFFLTISLYQLWYFNYGRNLKEIKHSLVVIISNLFDVLLIACTQSVHGPSQLNKNYD